MLFRHLFESNVCKNRKKGISKSLSKKSVGRDSAFDGSVPADSEFVYRRPGEGDLDAAGQPRQSRVKPFVFAGTSASLHPIQDPSASGGEKPAVSDGETSVCDPVQGMSQQSGKKDGKVKGKKSTKAQASKVKTKVQASKVKNIQEVKKGKKHKGKTAMENGQSMGMGKRKKNKAVKRKKNKGVAGNGKSVAKRSGRNGGKGGLKKKCAVSPSRTRADKTSVSDNLGEKGQKSDTLESEENVMNGAENSEEVSLRGKIPLTSGTHKSCEFDVLSLGSGSDDSDSLLTNVDPTSVAGSKRKKKVLSAGSAQGFGGVGAEFKKTFAVVEMERMAPESEKSVASVSRGKRKKRRSGLSGGEDTSAPMASVKYGDGGLMQDEDGEKYTPNTRQRLTRKERQKEQAALARAARAAKRARLSSSCSDIFATSDTEVNGKEMMDEDYEPPPEDMERYPSIMGVGSGPVLIGTRSQPVAGRTRLRSK